MDSQSKVQRGRASLVPSDGPDVLFKPKKVKTHARLADASQRTVYCKPAHHDVRSVCKTCSRIHVTQETLPGTVCLHLWATVSLLCVKSGDNGKEVRAREDDLGKRWKMKEKGVKVGERDIMREKEVFLNKKNVYV